MPVDLLGDRNYRAFLERVDEGQVALTHRASIMFHDGKTVPCHAKLYISGDCRRGLVNEVIGHILGKAAGLPVAQRAGIVMCTVAPLSIAYPELQWGSLGTARYPLWVAQTFDGKSPAQLFTTATPALRQDLNKWEQLCEAVGFDAWVANVDRNIGNLIRIGPGMYGLIDHGRLCGSDRWEADSLDAARFDHVNRLSWISWKKPHPPDPHKGAVLKACAGWRQAIAEAETALDVWLPRLLDARRGEHTAVLHYLRSRAYDCTRDLSKEYGVLPV